MAFMLRSHNGVHCCGTVGDSHPVHKVDLFSPQQSPNEFDSAFDLRKRSQLIAAKRTFTGDSFQNHDAKVRISEQNSKYLFENFRTEVLISELRSPIPDLQSPTRCLSRSFVGMPRKRTCGESQKWGSHLFFCILS